MTGPKSGTTFDSVAVRAREAAYEREVVHRDDLVLLPRG